MTINGLRFPVLETSPLALPILVKECVQKWTEKRHFTSYPELGYTLRVEKVENHRTKSLK